MCVWLTLGWLLAPPCAAAPELRSAPDPSGSDAAFLDVHSLLVHGVDRDTLSSDEVLALEVELGRVAGGWVAARPDLPRRLWRLDELGRSGERLYGSALEALAETVERAHARRGRAGIRAELRSGAVLHARGDRPRRSLIIELERDAVPVAPTDPLPASRDRFGQDAVLVSVRSLVFEGLQGLPVDEHDLLALEVELGWDRHKIPPGYVAARPGLVSESVPLWKLGRFRPGGAQLYGSAVQALLQLVGEALYARGVYNVTVDLEPGAIRRLATPGGDGLLMIRVIRE